MFNSCPTDLSWSKVLPGCAVIASLGLTVAMQHPAAAATLTPVDVELSLLVDVSASISSREYALQMNGYRDAFTNLAPLFGAGDFGDVAVNLIQWSSTRRQEESLSWTLLNSPASALQFASAIDALVRPYTGGTAPGSAIQFATPLFSSNDYEGQRWVIDVSGDGSGDVGIKTSEARDNALAAGVSAINGLPILNSRRSTLDDWYRDNIQGGEGSFVIAANGFEDVGRAMELKLRTELTPGATPPPSPPSEEVPEPATILGTLLAAAGFAYQKRRRSDNSERV